MAELVEGGEGTLADIARALVEDIRKNLSVDWLSREPVGAKLRTRIRRLLARYDYPPEEERQAVDLVIKQMETFANEWALLRTSPLRWASFARCRQPSWAPDAPRSLYLPSTAGVEVALL
ncbi:type I restriction enzyme endonuclease domain-containing protein [Phytomonospora endophytica]|uniref:Type I restriction enzyme HindI endonuclease subunit-like C-terminal domain-containing protein n=1 Tax=Phytomonospora endophytica TaxID=714109 RepID=A0A841FIZ7_9ACTN|nr:type I restriction enzyme endonuclease domain-containing protein [Phytomonospora endophytica]MBB6036176.1 hypothetical protein [Phytomonospora endophytica]GIG67081.1 hypothetical protein Pen01_33760 [Phytomonospora endophytica]